MKEKLKLLGLTENEIKVYLLMLESGRCTGTEIRRKTGIANSRVYAAIDSLLHKGIITYEKRQKGKLYSALDPTVISEVMKERLQKIEEVIPSLRYRYPKIARPFMEEVVRLCREYDLPIVPLDSPRNVVVGSERPSVSLTSGWVRDDWMAQQIIDFQHYDYFNQHYSSLFVEKPSYTGVLGFLGANHIKSTGIPARIPDTVTFIPELDNPIFSCLKSLMCRATGRVTPYYNYFITP